MLKFVLLLHPVTILGCLIFLIDIWLSFV